MSKELIENFREVLASEPDLVIKAMGPYVDKLKKSNPELYKVLHPLFLDRLYSIN